MLKMIKILFSTASQKALSNVAVIETFLVMVKHVFQSNLKILAQINLTNRMSSTIIILIVQKSIP